MIVCRTDAPTCDARYGGRYYCRLAPQHEGPHSCPAERDDDARR